MAVTPSPANDIARLLEENRLLREEVRAARRSSEVTAELVVQQFVDTDRMVDRLQEQAATETRLRRQLAAERRERELADERARLEAVDALAANDYDLVLMDVQMPVMDGFEATDTIRDPSSPVVNHDVPVVAMTAHAVSGFRERCLAHGMNDYVAKPVSHAALHRVLARQRLGATVDDAPPAVAAAGDPVFDWRGLLDRVGGNVALGRSVIEQFLEDTPAYVLEVVATLRAGDWPTVARQAHRLKGTSGTVGAGRLQALAQALEEQASSGSVADPAACERQLLAAIDDVLARMRETLTASAETRP